MSPYRKKKRQLGWVKIEKEEKVNYRDLKHNLRREPSLLQTDFNQKSMLMCDIFKEDSS